METVKYLMVGEDNQFAVVIHETLVQGLLHRLEANAQLHVVEDALQAVRLLRAVRQNVYVVLLLLIAQQFAGEQIEILVEHGLRTDAEGHVCPPRTCRAKKYRSEVQQAVSESLRLRQYLLAHQFIRLVPVRAAFLHLHYACRQGEPLLPDALHLVAKEGTVAHHQPCPLGQKLQYAYALPVVLCQFRYYAYLLQPLHRQLALHVKRAYAVYLVTEEVYAVGMLA